MDRAVARRILGVEPGAPATEIRSAYRSLLLRHHPDVARHAGDGGAADADAQDAAARTRLLTEARNVLEGATGPADDDRDEPEPEPAPGIVEVVGDDTIAVALPPDEVFAGLLEALSAVADITYVDAEAGLVEAVVVYTSGAVASLLVTLQGRATGTTDAFCTSTALLVDRPVEPLADLVTELADGLAAALRRS